MRCEYLKILILKRWNFNSDSFKIAQIDVKAANAPPCLFPVSSVYDKYTESVLYTDFGVPACNSSWNCLLCLNTKTNKFAAAHIKGQSLPAPSFIIPAETPDHHTRRYVVGFGFVVYIIEWDCSSPTATIIKTLLTIDDGNDRTRVGLGHRDPSGHSLFLPYGDVGLCGAQIYNASVYLYRKEKGLVEAISKMALPGGFAFFHGIVYVLDTCFMKIVAFKSDCDCDICKSIVECFSIWMKHSLKIHCFRLWWSGFRFYKKW